jgi:hypothetical protein
MKPLFLLAAAAFLLPPGALAAEDQPTAPGELVSRYWLEDPITLGGTLGFPNHVFSVSGAGTGKAKNLDYSPPQATDLTLTLGYGPFQFSYKLPVPQSSSSRATYGKADYSDFSFEFGRDRYAASVYYQTFQGFYADLNGNTGNFARIGSSDESDDASSGAFGAPGAVSAPQDILQRRDIHTRHYGAIAWHSIPLFGEGDQAFRISFQTLYDKPAPGFNLDLVNHAFYDRAQIQADAPLVPAKKASTFGNGAALRGLDAQSVGAGVGLASSYVFDESSFYLDGLFLYGGGLQRQRADYLDDHAWRTVYADNVNLRFGASYRGERQQAGLHFWVNTTAAPTGDVRIHSSNMALELSYLRTI